MRHMKSIAAIAVIALLVGCVSQQRRTYNTLATVKYATDASVSAYFELVARQQASIAGVPTVSKAYNTFEEVFVSAVSVAALGTNSVPTPGVIAASEGVTAAIMTAKGIQ